MYLLFDIGGTHMRLALGDGVSRTLDAITILDTPQDVHEGLALLASTAREIMVGKACRAAAGGIAGPFDTAHTRLLRAPHLPNWVGVNLKKEFEKAFGISVSLENDAALAGLGEAHFGAGKGREIIAYINIGTGVGGARIVGGRIDKNAFGFEPGRQLISMSAPYALEEYISGRGLEARFGKKPFEIKDTGVWDEIANYLARGIANTIVHWSPNVVLLGGALANAMPLDMLREQVKELLTIFPDLPPIEKAALGDSGGLWGALCYAIEKAGLRAQ